MGNIMMHILKQLLCVVAVASATEATTTASSGPSTTKDANATAGAQGLNVVGITDVKCICCIFAFECCLGTRCAMCIIARGCTWLRLRPTLGQFRHARLVFDVNYNICPVEPRHLVHTRSVTIS